jgi:hypothetical protein
LVWTAWDLGIRDATAIWFAQVVGREIRILDYYEASGGFKAGNICCIWPRASTCRATPIEVDPGMTAEVDRALSAQNDQPMLKSDKLEFERGAAAKTENEDRYKGKENRHHDRDGTAGS